MSENIEKKEEATTKVAVVSEASAIDIEQERIKQWRKRDAETQSRFKFVTKTTRNPETNAETVSLDLSHDEDLENADVDKRLENLKATFCAATGSPNPEYANEILMGAVRASGYDDKRANFVNPILKVMLSMKPADEYEGMLISRLIMLHEKYMHYMSCAEKVESRESQESYINSATKLIRLHNESLDALNKHRRRGEQKVTVTHNHVQVNDNASAIVNSQINQQGGQVNDKN